MPAFPPIHGRCLASISTMSAAPHCSRKFASFRSITSPGPRSIFCADTHAEIAARLGPNIELIGLGTGAGTKTRILIEALENPAVYVPIDISEKQLRKSTARFQKIFPDLEILPVCADYLQPVVLPSPRHKAGSQRRLFSRIDYWQFRTK